MKIIKTHLIETNLKTHLKKIFSLILAIMMITAIIPFISLPAYAEGEEVIKDVYLLLDDYEFTKFRLGYTEDEAQSQFRKIVKVRAKDQTKYYFNNLNSHLMFMDGNTFIEVGEGENPITSEKDYYLKFAVESKTGYIFSANPDYMNFYINGKKIEPYKVESAGTIYWIYVSAGPVFEKYMPRPQRNVRVKLYGHDDIHATWDAQVVEGATVKYKVEYKRSTWSDYKVLNYGTTRNYRKKANLVDGARYKFKVTPYVKIGEETYISYPGYSRYIYTLKKIAAPRVSKSSRNYVRLRWTNIPGETGYQISRSRYKTKNFKTVKRVSYKYSTTRIKTPRNRTYYYKIRAYKTVNGKRIYAPWSKVRAYRLR